MSTQQGTARTAAVHEAVSLLTYLAIMTAVSFAVLKRYEITRVWQQLTVKRMSPAQAEVERQVSEFRRDLARWNHPTNRNRRRGLYEDETK